MSSPTEWSRDALVSYLETHGIQVDESYDNDDLVALTVSLMDHDQAVPPMEIKAAVSAPVDTASVPTESSFRNNAITSFCEITGATSEHALAYLEAMAWNVDSAVAMYFDQQSNRPPQAPISRTYQNYSDLPPNHTASAEFAENLITSFRTGQNLFSTMATALDNANFAGFGEENHQYPSPKRTDEYDEHGIRRPDPVRQQRLVGGYTRRPVHTNRRHMQEQQDQATLGRADDPSVEWMYTPPRHLSFPSSFVEARALAKNDTKWLLVNIQSHEMFPSHRLNRDTWTDETLISIVRSSFVFWQRGHTTGDGKDYMRMYNINEHTLPHIAIVDPRTGGITLSISGFIRPEDLVTRLVEFMDTNSYSSSSCGQLRVLDTASWSTAGDMSVDTPMTPTSPSTPSASALITFATALDTHQEQEQQVSDDSAAVAAAEAQETARVPVYMSSLPSAEPGPDDADVTKVSIKLAAGGKPLVRRYCKTDKVAVLFAVAHNASCAEAQDQTTVQQFDLFTSFPTRSLHACMDQSLEEAAVLGSQIAMRWTLV